MNNRISGAIFINPYSDEALQMFLNRIPEQDDPTDYWAFFDDDGMQDPKPTAFDHWYTLGHFTDCTDHIVTPNHNDPDFAYLLRRNQRYSCLFDRSSTSFASLLHRVSETVCEFIESADPVILRQLVQAHHLDATVRTLYPQFREFFIRRLSGNAKQLPDDVKRDIDVAAELMALVIQNCRHTPKNQDEGSRVFSSTGFIALDLLRPSSFLRRKLINEKRSCSDQMQMECPPELDPGAMRV